MKKTNKYVKTRNQRLAHQQATSKPNLVPAPNHPPIKPSSALVNSTNAVPQVVKRPKGRPKKIKRITKEQTPQQKQKKVKQIKQNIVKKYKTKSTKAPILNPPLKKKYKKVKQPKNKLKINLQSSPVQQNIQIQQQKKPKGETFKIKLSGSIPKLTKIQDIEFKRQNPLAKLEASPQRINQGSVPKPSKSVKNSTKGSKSKLTVANQDSPSQQNGNIKLQPEGQKRKKGRPRKIIQPNIGSKIEQRTMDEQKVLDTFVQNAIKIRKLKNERQFFQSFSRIIEYMRDSWEFGELSKSMKVLPRAEDVLKIGIQIVRGIRKQLQVQALAQIV